MRQVLFLFAVGFLAAVLVGIASYYMSRARNSSRATWMTLMERLKPINRETFATVALDLLESEDLGHHLDPATIFEMLGGMRGMDALDQNCEVLIDLAAYVQRQHPEAIYCADELRLKAREIKWHIGRLRAASQTGHLRDHFPMYAQRAVATYYLMTRILLALYEGVQLPELAELQRAL